MKKHLLATSAIALGVAAAPAAAQDWNLDWGGYYNTHIAYSDVSGTAIAPGADFDGINIVGDGEIIFTPSVTLDNGLTFGINVQMEAQNGGGGADGIDESYITISGDSLGRIEIGGENSAGYKSMVGAPGVGSFAIMSASVSTVAPIAHAFRQAAGSPWTEVGGNNDVQRISYFTPSFNGLTVGVSYAPGNNTNASNAGAFNRNNTYATDIFDIGLNYSQSFGTVDLTVGARYGTGDAAALTVVTPATAGPDGLDGTADDVAAVTGPNTASDPETWGIGMQVGFGAFTVGGHYAENDNGAIGGAGDQEGWSLGATYDIAGPWSVGLQGFNGQTDGGAGVPDVEYNAYKLAGSRELGTGVSWDVYAIYAENQNVGNVANNDRDATIIGTSINLSF
ncbi:porin [Roseovarius sp. A21]|uniref:Porin n=1 Tax=Roseovarius bejariae TaxID=2576383 RepID=A0A844CUY8_9RHOB|nr:porin [Roseovarius bejariae]MRU14500.1 porin [Roseovarius bejariae]